MSREELEFFGGLIGFLFCLRWLMVIELKRLWQTHFRQHNGALQQLRQREALAELAATQAEQRALIAEARHGL